MKKLINPSTSAIQEMLDMYNSSFNLIKTTKKVFIERLLLKSKDTVIFCEYDGNKIIGFSIVNKNAIMLLCVDEKYKGSGIGSQLLQASETEIKKNYDKVNLGCGETYLIPGVPVDTKSNYSEWFLTRGYKQTWTSFDMLIDLKTQNYVLENSLTIRKANAEDLNTIIKVAEEAYGDSEVYKKQNINNVYVAIKDNEIIGLVIIEPNKCLYPLSIKNCGIFGCICIKKEYRKHGYGMELLKYALIELQKQNDYCHIGYTYLDWWYKKVGATKYIEYTMCEKDLK